MAVDRDKTRKIFADAIKRGQDNLAAGEEYWKERVVFYRLQGDKGKEHTAQSWVEACRKTGHA